MHTNHHYHHQGDCKLAVILYVSTFVHTTTTGIPRFCVSVPSPSGSRTLSSSSALRCGAPSSLPGSVYSWNCLMTANKHMGKQWKQPSANSRQKKNPSPPKTYACAPFLEVSLVPALVCQCVRVPQRPTSEGSPGHSTAVTCQPWSAATCHRLRSQARPRPADLCGKGPHPGPRRYTACDLWQHNTHIVIDLIIIIIRMQRHNSLNEAYEAFPIL